MMTEINTKPIYVNQILYVLSNIDRVNTLSTIRNKNLTFSEILEQTGIPRSSLHGHLQLLVQVGLVTKSYTSDYFYYKSNIKSLTISIGDDLSIWMEMINGDQYKSIDDEMVVI